jgi:hypothetical protein
MPHPVKLTLNLAVEDTQIFAPSIPPKDRVKDDPDGVKLDVMPKNDQKKEPVNCER